MAPQVNPLTAKLRIFQFPGLIWQDGRTDSYKLFCDFPICTVAHMHTHTHTYTHAYTHTHTHTHTNTHTGEVEGGEGRKMIKIDLRRWR